MRVLNFTWMEWKCYQWNNCHLILTELAYTVTTKTVWPTWHNPWSGFWMLCIVAWLAKISFPAAMGLALLLLTSISKLCVFSWWHDLCWLNYNAKYFKGWNLKTFFFFLEISWLPVAGSWLVLQQFSWVVTDALHQLQWQMVGICQPWLTDDWIHYLKQCDPLLEAVGWLWGTNGWNNNYGWHVHLWLKHLILKKINNPKQEWYKQYFTVYCPGCWNHIDMNWT